MTTPPVVTFYYFRHSTHNQPVSNWSMTRLLHPLPFAIRLTADRHGVRCPRALALGLPGPVNQLELLRTTGLIGRSVLFVNLRSQGCFMLNLSLPRLATQLATVMLAATAVIPMAHAVETGQDVSATPRVQPLTRAEVNADVILWRRAKVDEYGSGEMTPTPRAERERRAALYERWRQGPEFQEELRRQQGADRR